MGFKLKLIKEKCNENQLAFRLDFLEEIEIWQELKVIVDDREEMVYSAKDEEYIIEDLIPDRVYAITSILKIDEVESAPVIQLFTTNQFGIKPMAMDLTNRRVGGALGNNPRGAVTKISVEEK